MFSQCVVAIVFLAMICAYVLFVLYRVARFFLVQHTKTGKLYQNGEKYTKTGINIPKLKKYTTTGKYIPKQEKIYQMTTKSTK
jgi:hypothetical protein